MEEDKSRVATKKKELEEKKKDSKKKIDLSQVNVSRVEDQAKWAEFRITSILPERRSYMSSCIHKGRY